MQERRNLEAAANLGRQLLGHGFEARHILRGLPYSSRPAIFFRARHILTLGLAAMSYWGWKGSIEKSFACFLEWILLRGKMLVNHKIVQFKKKFAIP